MLGFMFRIGLTDHLEGPLDRPSSEVYNEVSQLVQLADELGVRYAWFAEHHGHVHHGHLPEPLLMALHLAGKTHRIQLGSAVVCLNMHNAMEVAERIAVMDTLTHQRLAPGFGSGSTPEETALLGVDGWDESERHPRFAGAIQTMLAAWSGKGTSQAADGRDGGDPSVSRVRILPRADPSLIERCWVAVNSDGSAEVAGRFNLNVLFSHLRTPQQYRDYCQTYRQAGGRGLIAANRPIFVAADDATAFRLIEPALRTLWRRFQREGKISASLAEPTSVEELCAHPINFIVGGPESVARQLRELHDQVPFDVANLEFRWADLPHELVLDSLRRLMSDVVPLLR